MENRIYRRRVVESFKTSKMNKWKNIEFLMLCEVLCNLGIIQVSCSKGFLQPGITAQHLLIWYETPLKNFEYYKQKDGVREILSSLMKRPISWHTRLKKRARLFAQARAMKGHCTAGLFTRVSIPQQPFSNTILSYKVKFTT